MLPFVENDWKTSLRGQIFYNCQKCSHKPGTKQQLCSLPYVVPRSTVFFFTQIWYVYAMIWQHFSCLGPKHISIVIFSISLVCCQLEDKGRTTLHRLLWHKSTKLMLRGGNHPGATEKMHFRISFFKFCIFVSVCLYFVFLYGELTLPQPRFLPNGGCGKKQVFGAKASFVCHLPDDGQEIWGKHLITAGSYHLLQFNLRKYEKNISLQLVPYSILKHLVRNIT